MRPHQLLDEEPQRLDLGKLVPGIPRRRGANVGGRRGDEPGALSDRIFVPLVGVLHTEAEGRRQATHRQGVIDRARVVERVDVGAGRADRPLPQRHRVEQPLRRYVAIRLLRADVAADRQPVPEPRQLPVGHGCAKRNTVPFQSVDILLVQRGVSVGVARRPPRLRLPPRLEGPRCFEEGRPVVRHRKGGLDPRVPEVHGEVDLVRRLQ